jgi:hypothetical protein
MNHLNIPLATSLNAIIVVTSLYEGLKLILGPGLVSKNSLRTSCDGFWGKNASSWDVIMPFHSGFCNKAALD